jgi:tetratricopeptide (TPR) repeat protein
MARVYVSSTVLDLKQEREAVMKWLVQANHQPVHSYRPDSETVRESCLNDIDGCDLYVLILGHRYGFQPENDNPDKLSITQLEFRRAKQSGIPRVALLRISVPDIRLSDLGNPERGALVRAFEEEVRREVRSGEFADLSGLIGALSTGVLGELEKRRGQGGSGGGIASDDPNVVSIVATLTRVIDENGAEIRSLREQNEKLKEQLRSAVARTLDAADRPDATPAQIAAVQALEAGNTQPAEALLRVEEKAQAANIGGPEVDDSRSRREAAELAREQGALAFGHDVTGALAAFERAAEYQPDDTWTHFFVGDLHVSLGRLSSALDAYQKGAVTVESRLRADQNDFDALRDLSVSYDRIGDVLRAQGDLNAALDSFQRGLKIRETLAARDPANTEWQRDLSVSCNKIGDALRDQGDLNAALNSFQRGLKIRETLAARDSANSQWQTDVAMSCARLAQLEHGLDADLKRDYLMRGREILIDLKARSRLSPDQDRIAWFDEQLALLPADESKR